MIQVGYLYFQISKNIEKNLCREIARSSSEELLGNPTKSVTIYSRQYFDIFSILKLLQLYVEYTLKDPS